VAIGTVGVVGLGTMGAGIAQVCLEAGHAVIARDVEQRFVDVGTGRIEAGLAKRVEKQLMTADAADGARGRLTATTDLAAFAAADLVIEAIVEDLEPKRELFGQLDAICRPDAILATNTSALSVSAVAAASGRPSHVVGLHFFNPAPLLPLVEVVSGFATDVTSATRAYETARAWGKTPVACADTPGFIVNRIARPFYAEAFAVHESQAADPATIDAVLRESGGFRMGAFELTDLIGQDVNESVTHSVWRSFFQDVRFTPSLAQRRLVESGRLGRKTGHGWYDYGDGAEPSEPHTAEKEQPPAYVVAEGDLGPAADVLALIREAGIRVREDEEDNGTRLVLPSGGQLVLADGQTSVEFRDVVYFDLALDYRKATRIALSASQDTAPQTLSEAIGLFQALGKDVSVIGDCPGMIVARTVARIVDLAYDAVAKGVATEEDIDTAMRLGVNYPLGPFEWSRRLGASWSYDVLDELHERDPSGRYAPSLALYRHAYADEKREGTQ